jgi:hypothetical protein
MVYSYDVQNATNIAALAGKAGRLHLSLGNTEAAERCFLKQRTYQDLAGSERRSHDDTEAQLIGSEYTKIICMIVFGPCGRPHRLI